MKKSCWLLHLLFYEIINKKYSYMIEKKIGIVTYWDTEENYGQVLQLFALQWQLTKLD